MTEEVVRTKKKVYVETSVIGYLVARPSRDVIKNAWQVATREWWETAHEHYELYTSPVVEREAAKGDADAAARRLAAIKTVQSISMCDEMVALAEKLLEATAVPRTSFDDALHISAAAIAGMDFLLSWNCRHIANPETRPLIRKVCEEMGYRYPEICTPFEMLGGTP